MMNRASKESSKKASVKYELVDQNPNPTREELAYGISGNLCRCQDYDKILTAFMRGAELSRGVNHV
jgi:aerobic-type carbon monoxide dehydrogenase small subunit (CoxS/CutS family)